MKRRVVLTGLGIISCLGNTYREVVENLRRGRSGIRQASEWQKFGLTSTVAGLVSGIEEIRQKSGIGKKFLNCMSEGALYCVLAAKDAIDDAQLDEQILRNKMSGCLVGSGVGSTGTIYDAGKKLYAGKSKRISPYSIIRSMSNTCSANISNLFQIGGRSYSISSACATSLHNIGHAFELVRSGALDMAIAGGGEEMNVLTASAFCAIRRAVSTKYNHQPDTASRPYDADRDGFVLSEGGGIVILEDLDRAKARGVKIYGEITGFWANCDGYDMILPELEGKYAGDCIRMALKDAGINPEAVDYVNTHGTSTVAGDIAEIKALRNVFGDDLPFLSSTKSMGGHSLGAVGAHEVIHCIAMLDGNFIAPSINIFHRDPFFRGVPIITETTEKSLTTVMSTSFGFGGTNGVIVIKKYPRP
jgi:3-oxoacyl-[acyl-carrier-protein] synthase-1